MMELLEPILEVIYQFGVVPILLLIIYKLNNKLTDSEEKRESLIERIHEGEIERTKIIENNLAILEKFSDKFNDLKDEVRGI